MGLVHAEDRPTTISLKIPVQGSAVSGQVESHSQDGTCVLWVQAKGLSWKYHPGWAMGSSWLVSALRGQLPTAAAGRCCVPLLLAGPCGPFSAQKESFLQCKF